MVIRQIEDFKIKEIANAIRAKTGKAEGMTLDQMPSLIASIRGDGNVPVPVCVASVANDISHNVKNVINIEAAVSFSEIEIGLDDTGVSCYFDCRKGVTATAWENQYGDNDIELYNPVITSNYVEVIGSTASYGKLTHGGASGTSVKNQDYSTRYFVFKNLSSAYAEWKTIIGNESEQYCCSTIAMNPNGGLKFTRNDLSFTNYNCSDWHVIAIRSTKGGTTEIWVDGVSVGSASNCQGWAADTYLARGPGWYYPDNNTAFRAIIVADVKHTNRQIVRNCLWLKEQFIDAYSDIEYSDIEYLESNGSQLLDTGVLSTSNISYEIQYAVIGGGDYLYQCIIGSKDFHNSFYPYCWDNANGVASGEYVAYSHNGVEWANLGTNLQRVKTTLKKTGNLFQLSAENGFSKELQHQSNASFSLATTMNIFGMSTGTPDYCVAKVYYCKIWDGGTLVRDFVPMQRIGGQRGLFDKVTNKFYTMQ